MKSNPRLLALTLVGGFLILGNEVFGDDTADEIGELKRQIQSLDQKVRILERRSEVDKEVASDRAAEASKTAPVVTAGGNGLSFRSADTNFMIALKGLVQADSRSFLHDGGIKGNDTFLLRRARPIIQGTVFRDFDFLLTPEFGGSTVQILDAYLNYRLRPEFQVQAGKFKSPVGLEQLQSDAAMAFNERSLATDLVPNRDVGFELHGDLWGGVVSYADGIFNGAPDYSSTAPNSDFEDNKAFAGRLFFQPFRATDISVLKGLGFGLGASYEVDRAATNTSATGLTAGYLSDGQQRIFSYSPTNGSVFADGTHWRLSPQGYYYYGPFGFMGEYVVSNERVTNSKLGSADLENTAWQIAGSWVLTGEAASYAGVNPRRVFDPVNGSWGAVQLVARYAELDVDPATFPAFADPRTSASAARAWAVGVNWYLNRNIRVNASFSRTTFEGGGGAKATVTKQPEEVLFTRVQLAF